MFENIQVFTRKSCRRQTYRMKNERKIIMKGLRKNEVRKKEEWEGRKEFDKKKEQRKKAFEL